MEGAVVEAAKAGVLVAVGVGDIVLKAEEEMPERFPGFEVKLANAKWGVRHIFIGAFWLSHDVGGWQHVPLCILLLR